MKVLRGMTADEDGLPKVGASGRYLGARPRGGFRDIDVDESGMVYPGTGGMSVSPLPPTNLPEHRRPPEFGGYGEDPVYEFDTDELPPALSYRPDPNNPERRGAWRSRTISEPSTKHAVHGGSCDNISGGERDGATPT
ncbi:MAG: hypothetical protein ACRDSJ_15075 [Rubrobacteraceae bacterium]